MLFSLKSLVAAAAVALMTASSVSAHCQCIIVPREVEGREVGAAIAGRVAIDSCCFTLSALPPRATA
ncbi:unnamed protein product [Mycena citricolor]|uniref:Uncharacterized protein n=1 Tax=Mycena citricolor TaxID=2018698 RepID=A0AAD2HK25_9AGAR|nr:unnamed protein product [Mycena citricolor]CAK5276840.1 unnamed protein product [Mycena citricolor]